MIYLYSTSRTKTLYNPPSLTLPYRKGYGTWFLMSNNLYLHLEKYLSFIKIIRVYILLVRFLYQNNVQLRHYHALQDILSRL